MMPVPHVTVQQPTSHACTPSLPNLEFWSQGGVLPSSVPSAPLAVSLTMSDSPTSSSRLQRVQPVDTTPAKATALQQEVAKLLDECRQERRQTMDFTDIQDKFDDEFPRVVIDLKHARNDQEYIDRYVAPEIGWLFEYLDTVQDAVCKFGPDASVTDYEQLKSYRTATPSNPNDVKPTHHQEATLAHGTNLKTVASALLFSRGQLVPGLKARKLGLNIETGENRGVSTHNLKYVSSVNIKGEKITSLPVAAFYALNAATSKAPTESRQKNEAAFSIFKNARNYPITCNGRQFLPESLAGNRLATTPVIVLGENTKAQIVEGGLKDEMQSKRLNLRELLVPDESVALVEEVVRQCGEQNVVVRGFSELELTALSADRHPSLENL